jgi:hypothetical protein
VDHAQTQWRTSASGLRTGLSYGSVLASLQHAYPRKPARRRRLYAGIRVIEAAMLGVQREVVAARMGDRTDGRK